MKILQAAQALLTILGSVLVVLTGAAATLRAAVEIWRFVIDRRDKRRAREAAQSAQREWDSIVKELRALNEERRRKGHSDYDRASLDCSMDRRAGAELGIANQSLHPTWHDGQLFVSLKRSLFK